MNKNETIPNRFMFEHVQFHDCKIYGFGFNSEQHQFLIDIDFVGEWINNENSDYYSFYVSPTTLVFENVWNLEVDISMNTELCIDNIERFNPSIPRNIDFLPKSTQEYDWKIELLQGEISFKSIGMKFYKRTDYIKQNSQTIAMKYRGGISFDEKGELFCVD